MLAHSPDDISGFATLSGNDAVAGVTLPFAVNIDGTNFTTATISTNGVLTFGTTSGSAIATNSALSTSSFSGPTLFWYWDDLVTEGTHIRYGTVGTAPNRTFIVDFQAALAADTTQKLNGQVQIHEASNTISVKYRDTLSPNANGQSATIGFQGAGGSSARAHPLVFNGKILDDNRPHSGWSVAPLPTCSNGLLETGEHCDLGASNGASSTCCTTVCRFRSSAEVCRASAGSCDPAESCTGTSATCPADALSPAGTVCNPSAGTCDPAEVCTGTSVSCPPNQLSPAGTVCRPSIGICDVTEVCTGTNANCPADSFAAAGTLCRSVAGACDVAEFCTGTSNTCPADGFA